MKELIAIAGALKALHRQPCSLATVIRVEGSSYRRPGARMLMTPERQVWGMVSGGCLEHDILDHGRRALRSGESRVVRYDSTSEDDIVFGTGLGCNGVIDVLIEPVTETFRDFFVESIEACQTTRRQGAVATPVQGQGTFTSPGSLFQMDGRWIGNQAIIPMARNVSINSERAGLAIAETSDGLQTIFVQPLLPPIRIVAFGGWLDLVPLIRIGRELGWEVVVVDSRQRSGSFQVFREADAVLLSSPSDALQAVAFDQRTIALLMNHNFDQDLDALVALTRISLPFVGLLGPKRRRAKLLDALNAQGVVIPEGWADRLHGPVGLDIGADNPEQIALSIVAEILTVLNDRSGEPMHERFTPLHLRQPDLVYG